MKSFILFVLAVIMFLPISAHTEVKRAKIWQQSVAKTLTGDFECSTIQSVALDKTGSQKMSPETFRLNIKQNAPSSSACNGEFDCAANFLIQKKRNDGTIMFFYAPTTPEYAVTYPSGFIRIQPTNMTFHTAYTVEQPKANTLLISQFGTCKRRK